ncbi:MAG: TlpA family protein disulfide reductase [Syntrophales bacterium LBB04]|nr:TlpA family protein disulfide reductase [Syntrophales bacterium LBB04]
MKRIFFLVVMLLAFILSSPPTRADQGPPQVGSPFPDIGISAPTDPKHKDYLGLSNAESFKISDLAAKVVIIEIFSMYCPFCQQEAPRVNKLFQMIEEKPQLKGKVKMIGLGVGNSTFEVDVFGKNYNVIFPLLPDEDYKLHQALGKTRTPYFLVVEISPKNRTKVVYSQLGALTDLDKFMDLISKSVGMVSGGSQ